MRLVPVFPAQVVIERVFWPGLQEVWDVTDGRAAQQGRDGLLPQASECTTAEEVVVMFGR